MSRVAKMPIIIPNDIEVNIKGQFITIKNKNNELNYVINKSVDVNYNNNILTFKPKIGFIDGWIQAGTTRSILNSIIIGITEGFTKKLQLIGVGYRVSVKDNIINLLLGFSHAINHKLPVGIVAECPSQTEIVLKGADKQLVGQVAADLRSYRPPEPYKGKGIRYANEIINIKEAKKK